MKSIYQKNKPANAFSLLEIIICIGILSLFIPVMMFITVNINKQISKQSTKYFWLSELNYLEDFIRQDLLTTTKIIKYADSLLAVQKENEEIIEYTIEKKELKRKIMRSQALLSTKHTLILNSVLQAINFQIKFDQAQIKLNCVFKEGTREIVIYLPNL